jgi:hypothetical protein
MSKPSKTPEPFVSAPFAMTTGPTPAAEPVLTVADCEVVAALDPAVTVDAHARGDMLDLLTDEETLDALAKYASVFNAVGIPVTPVTASLPQIQKLQRVRRHLELALDVVNRNLHATGAPAAETVSSLRRFITSTPERSPLRIAFSLFNARWEETFRAQGRPTKTAEKSTPEKPAEPK